MIKTILFDVDGTIIDTEYVMIHSLQRTLMEEKKQEVSERDLQYILGIPGKEAVKIFAANEAEADHLLSKWGENVLSLSDHAQLFPNMREVIHELHAQDIRLGIVTSKTREEMKNEFDIFELNHYFDVQVNASDTKLHKPHPDPIQRAIDELGIKKEEAIYIGDSLYDMQSAKACGIPFGLAKWGAKDLSKFNDADKIMETPESLFDLFK